MRIATLIALIGLITLSTLALAENKWPDDYVPGIPYDGGRVGGETIETAVAIASLPFADDGETCGYADDYDEVCPYTGSTSPDVVYSFSPGSSCVVDITLCNYSQYDTKLYVYENVAGALVACNDDECTSGAGQSWVSELLGVALSGGSTYYIVVDGYYGDCGYYTIDMSGDCGAVATEQTTWGVVKSLYR